MKKLPADVLRQLRTKFPNVPELESIVDAVFTEIAEKTFDDGSCSVQKFGTFYCYKAFSSKKGKFVPRFKFRISRSFTNSINSDEFTLQRINTTLERVFSDDKKENLKYQKIRDINLKNHNLVLNGQRKVRALTDEHEAYDEILDILDSGDSEDQN